MKNVKIFSAVLFALVASFVFHSCLQEQDIATEVETEVNDVRLNKTKAFKPSADFSIKDGHLSFPTFADMDLFQTEVNYADHKALNAWEDQNGIKTQRQTFYNVMVAEDAISDNLFEMAETNQAQAANTPEMTSEALNTALADGTLRFYTSPEDGSTYWDYTLVEPGVAGLVNQDGLVEAEGNLIRYSNDAFIYYAKDGNMSTLMDAESYTDNYDDPTKKVVKRGPYTPEGPTNPTDGDPGPDITFRSTCSADGIHTINYSKFNSWRSGGSRKRIRAWIDGSATANFGQPCRYGTTCTFYLRTQAQKKNFWGNYRYTSSYGPSCYVDDGDWDYFYELIEPAGTCSSDNQTKYTNAITGGSNPKPLWDKYIPWTNNGFFPMHPHTNGWWTFKQGGVKKYICRTIDMTYDIPAFYQFPASTWNLTK